MVGPQVDGSLVAPASLPDFCVRARTVIVSAVSAFRKFTLNSKSCVGKYIAGLLERCVATKSGDCKKQSA